MKCDPLIVISDIKTYRIMSNNRNYEERLYEVYKYIKSKKINKKIDFVLLNDEKTGTFTYEEISIFDRLKNKEYREIIENSWQLIHQHMDLYINDTEIGNRISGHKSI